MSLLPCLVCCTGSTCWKSRPSFLSVPSTFSTEDQGLGTKYVREKKIKKTLNASLPNTPRPFHVYSQISTWGCLIWFAIREMQIKSTMQHHHTASEWLTWNNDISCRWRRRETRSLPVVAGNTSQNLFRTWEKKQLGSSNSNQIVTTMQPSNDVLRYLYQRNENLANVNSSFIKCRTVIP